MGRVAGCLEWLFVVASRRQGEFSALHTVFYRLMYLGTLRHGYLILKVEASHSSERPDTGGRFST